MQGKIKIEEKVKVEEYPNSIVQNPLVSVCVQTYRHVDYISKCLDSILNQETNFNFEILLGDDESEDGTRELCIQYARKNPEKIRLFLHNRKNTIFIKGKPSGRFNFLYNLDSSKGKYIALCEGDDYWTDPYKFQKQVDFLEANPNCSMCFTNRIEVNSEGKKLFEKKYENKIYQTKEIIEGFIPPTQTIMFRNSPDLVNFLNNFKDFPSGDRILTYYCSFWGDIMLIPELTAAYRHSGGGVWSSFDKKKQSFVSLIRFIDFHIRIGIPVNNEFIHNRINGYVFYLLKKYRESFFADYKKIRNLKKKYGINSSLMLYIINKMFGKKSKK